MKEKILESFKEYTQNEIAAAKIKLDAIPSKGTITGFSQRIIEFKESLEYLNKNFVGTANEYITRNSEISNLDNELFDIAKSAIEDYIIFFNS